MAKRIGRYIGSAAIAALLGTLAPVAAQTTISLRMIPPVGVPAIEKKVVRVKVDLIFDYCPQEYWVYYKKDTGRLVVEFFGFHVDAPPIEIKGTSIVSDLKVVNSETSFALNGQYSQISMAMQDGWHYESRILQGGKVLRLQLWMPLNPGKALHTKKRNLWLPILVISIASVSIAAGIIAGLADYK